MDIVPLLFMAAMVKKAVDLLRYAFSGDVNGIITQVVAWAVGIGVVFLVAYSDLGHQVNINGASLASLNQWTWVLAGLALSSGAGFGADTLRALDNTDSASMPSLTAGQRVPPQQGV